MKGNHINYSTYDEKFCVLLELYKIISNIIFYQSSLNHNDHDSLKYLKIKCKLNKKRHTK